MIINQTIKNGFTIVNKTGAYFSLISAGGVVNVRLSEKGRTVLDTKMWVGMSIDKAIHFDEITIKGDDGAVEFWAGDVSMSQARSASAGAKAIRVSIAEVDGYVNIASGDLTRSAVRVRPDKDVYLMGAAFTSGGWRVAANEIAEIPLAGSLYAYKPRAFLDFSKTVEYGSVSDFWFGNCLGQCWVSDDTVTRLCTAGVFEDELMLTTDSGATWNLIHTDVKSYTVDARTGIQYVLKIIGSEVRLMKSTDGVIWTVLASAYIAAEIGSSSWGYPSIINNWYQQKFTNGSILVNLSNGEIKTKTVLCDGNQLGVGFWLDDLMTGVFSVSALAGVYRTTDGGNTWMQVLAKSAIYMKVAPDGENLCLTASDGAYLSSDGGENIVKAGAISVIDGSQPCHIKDCIFAFFRAGRLIYASLDNNAPYMDYLTAQSLNYHSKFVGFNPSTALIYTDRHSFGSSHQATLFVSGDLRPASVEVMELLS